MSSHATEGYSSGAEMEQSLIPSPYTSPAHFSNQAYTAPSEHHATLTNYIPAPDAMSYGSVPFHDQQWGAYTPPQGVMTNGSVPFYDECWSEYGARNGLDQSLACRSAAQMQNAGYDARLAHGYGEPGYAPNSPVWSPQQAGLSLSAQRYSLHADSTGLAFYGASYQMGDAGTVAEGRSSRFVSLWNAVVAMAQQLHERYYGVGARVTVQQMLSDLASFSVRMCDDMGCMAKDKRAKTMFKYLAGKVTEAGQHSGKNFPRQPNVYYS